MPATDEIRVLVVDDEALTRRQICSYLSSAPGVTLVGKACDGEDAVEKARQLRPDLVLMDIRMPRLDGLTAARRIRRWDPDAVIIFLTAHAQFEYAQEAVRLGAEDCVLKPVEPDKLLCAVRRAIARSPRGGRRGETPVSADDSLLAIFRKEFVNILVTWPGMISEEEAVAQAEALGLRGGLPRAVMVGHLESPPGPEWETRLISWDGGDMLIWRQLSYLTGVACPWPVPPDPPKPWVDEVASRLRVAYQGARVAGRYCSTLSELPTSYREAAIEAAGKTAVGTKSLLNWEREICELALRGDFAEATEVATRLLRGMTPAEASDEAPVLAGLLASAFARLGLDAELVAELRVQCQRTIREGTPTAPGWASVLEHFAQEMRDRFTETQSAGARAVQLACEYVQENYARDFSLADVASHVHFSPYYFTRLFKAETGMTLGEYRTNVRLSRATDLLVGTDLPVRSVAEQVGYRSYHYFATRFKEKFGTTPNQYRCGANEDGNATNSEGQGAE